MLAAATLKAVPAVPMLPAVDVTLSVGVVIVPKPALVILALAVSETDVVPVTEPPRVRAPALEVRLTVCALIVPAAELVKSPAVVPTVKLVPAPEAPEIFVALALVMFTSCPAAFALALMLAAETVSAVPAVPIPPAADVTLRVGVVIVPKLALVIPEFAISPTVFVPVMAPASANPPPLEFRRTSAADMVPAAVLIKLPAPTVLKVKLVAAPDAPTIEPGATS